MEISRRVRRCIDVHEHVGIADVHTGARITERAQVIAKCRRIRLPITIARSALHGYGVTKALAVLLPFGKRRCPIRPQGPTKAVRGTPRPPGPSRRFRGCGASRETYSPDKQTRAGWPEYATPP